MDSGNVGAGHVKLLSQSTALFSTCTHSSPALSILKRQKNRKHPRHFTTLSAPETPTTHPTPPLPCRVTFLTGHNCSVGSELEEGVTAILSRILGLSSCCCVLAELCCCQYTWKWAEVVPSFQQRRVSTLTERHRGHVFSRSNHRHRHSSQNTCWGHRHCHQQQLPLPGCGE